MLENIRKYRALINNYTTASSGEEAYKALKDFEKENPYFLGMDINGVLLDEIDLRDKKIKDLENQIECLKRQI